MFNTTAAMLSTLKGMPMTILLSLLLAPVLPIGEKEIASMIGINRKTARQHLRFLQNLGLTQRSGNREAWLLTTGAYQLPLPLAPLGDGRPRPVEALAPPSEGKSYPHESTGAAASEGKSYPYDADNPPSLASYPQPGAAIGASEGKSYPHPDQIRSEDDDEEGVDNHPPPASSLSLHLLDAIGMGGNALEAMARHPPEEILAAWWFLTCQTWPRNHRSVLRTHLLDDHRTPTGFSDLAHWWVATSPADHQELIAAVEEAGLRLQPRLPEELSQSGFEAARTIWQTRRSFDLHLPKRSRR